MQKPNDTEIPLFGFPFCLLILPATMKDQFKKQIYETTPGFRKNRICQGI